MTDLDIDLLESVEEAIFRRDVQIQAEAKDTPLDELVDKNITYLNYGTRVMYFNKGKVIQKYVAIEESEIRIYPSPEGKRVWDCDPDVRVPLQRCQIRIGLSGPGFGETNDQLRLREHRSFSIIDTLDNDSTDVMCLSDCDAESWHISLLYLCKIKPQWCDNGVLYADDNNYRKLTLAQRSFCDTNRVPPQQYLDARDLIANRNCPSTAEAMYVLRRELEFINLFQCYEIIDHFINIGWIDVERLIQ